MSNKSEHNILISQSKSIFKCLQTAIANRLKPLDYIQWYLDNVSTIPINDIEQLAPWSDNILPILKDDRF